MYIAAILVGLLWISLLVGIVWLVVRFIRSSRAASDRHQGDDLLRSR
jgi:hypothetical protein